MKLIKGGKQEIDKKQWDLDLIRNPDTFGIDATTYEIWKGTTINASKPLTLEMLHRGFLIMKNGRPMEVVKK